MKSLYLAMELSNNTWKLGFRHSNKPKATKIIDVPARNWAKFEEAVETARSFFRAEAAPCRSCYEAGRDGFWIHRGLEERSIANDVIDSASIPVSRRKQVKTDKVDVRSLLDLLQDYHESGKKMCIVEVPTPRDEDDRHFHRELEHMKKRKTSLSNRIKSHLIAYGIKLDNLSGLDKFLPKLKDGNDKPLSAGLLRALLDLYKDYRQLDERIKAYHADQDRQLATPCNSKLKQARDLARFRGIGNRSSWILVMEVFGWRVFKNRKQAGGYTGLTPTPFQSGNLFKEQGISKAGNARIRWLMVELAWLWIRWQPTSKLTHWYYNRISGNSRRHKKATIVAVARKLFVDLWRYLNTGTVPQGAVIV